VISGRKVVNVSGEGGSKKENRWVTRVAKTGNILRKLKPRGSYNCLVM